MTDVQPRYGMATASAAGGGFFRRVFGAVDPHDPLHRLRIPARLGARPSTRRQASGRAFSIPRSTSPDSDRRLAHDRDCNPDNFGEIGKAGWRGRNGSIIRAIRQDSGSGIFVTAVQV